MPKITRKLTETEIKNARPAAKAYKLYDEGGLLLLVRPSGTKVWQYPYKYNDKYNILTIGQYGTTPDKISSAEARKLRDHAKKLLKEGIAPNDQKKTVRLKALYESKNSFDALAREWYSKQNWAPKHAANVLSRLEKDIFPHIGHKPINKINRQEMLHALQKVEARGALDVAKRLNQYCTAVFEYALIKGLCENNPAVGLSKVLKSKKVEHRRHISEDKLPAFLTALEGYRGSELVKLAMKLLILTLVRPGELRTTRYEELNDYRRLPVGSPRLDMFLSTKLATMNPLWVLKLSSASCFAIAFFLAMRLDSQINRPISPAAMNITYRACMILPCSW